MDCTPGEGVNQSSARNEALITMNWKTAYRSFYYQGAPEPDDLVMPPAETVMLSIDVQNIT